MPVRTTAVLQRVRVLALAVAMLPGPASTAQVFHVEQMNTSQIAGLDREKTAVLLWGGILEEHGLYLPSFTDGYINEYLTRRLAEAIAARPGWAVLIFPPVPLAPPRPTALVGGGCSPAPMAYARRRCEPCSWTSQARSARKASAGCSSCMDTARLRTTVR